MRGIYARSELKTKTTKSANNVFPSHLWFVEVFTFCYQFVFRKWDDFGKVFLEKFFLDCCLLNENKGSLNCCRFFGKNFSPLKIKVRRNTWLEHNRVGSFNLDLKITNMEQFVVFLRKEKFFSEHLIEVVYYFFTIFFSENRKFLHWLKNLSAFLGSS